MLRYRPSLQTELIHFPLASLLSRSALAKYQKWNDSSNKSRWSGFLQHPKKENVKSGNCLQCLPLASVRPVRWQTSDILPKGLRGNWWSCFKASQRFLSTFLNAVETIVSASGCWSWTYRTKTFRRGSVRRFPLANELMRAIGACWVDSSHKSGCYALPWRRGPSSTLPTETEKNAYCRQ